MRKGWLYTREELMWFVKDNKKFVWNKNKQYDLNDKRLFSLPNNKSDFKRWTNVWVDIKEVAGGMKSSPFGHFTPKPEKAIQRIIELHTQEGDTVLDCFAGSGTTGAVAKKTNRNYILIEKDAAYCEKIKNRIDNV
jgi:DNA modification methylase